ncbi:cyclic di-GMP phosphodiesterase Gmr [mine drainage metagenome]|uniref:Cyclic di-GMP phosphodiesterase Gmr n=1 Tax=mine drainage metagenome TaxID=410659 RepID=A0A1J5RGR0_9ZZZZ
MCRHKKQNIRAGFSFLIRHLAICAGFFLFLISTCHANPAQIAGQWYEVNHPSVAINALPLTGGDFLFNGQLHVAQSGEYVIDFKNTSTFSSFKHTILNSRQGVIAHLEGGISSTVVNPFALRHGRVLHLDAGNYTLQTLLKTPYLIAQPAPYIDGREQYQQAIKLGNVIALLCMGVLAGLMAYYIVLGLIRRQMVHGMYALFILGNLLLQGTSLLVFSDTFGMHWFYLSAMPILFSNIAYIFFVKGLLNIERENHPDMYRLIQYALGILVVFALWGLFSPNWMMQMARYGVGVFLCLGLVCSIDLSRKKNMTARYYLIAILTFFILGGLTITAQHFAGYTFYIEHLGLIAVTIEALLLSFVLSYQFSELFKEKELALAALDASETQARTDKLTGLPNRIALERAIHALPESGSITMLDLDHLKYYNDTYGHAYGDQLLREFSFVLREKLGSLATLHRLGGDEFAITCPTGNEVAIRAELDKAMAYLQAHGFEYAGASAGTAFIYEHPANYSMVMHLADTRMYENKRLHKKERPQ